MFKINLMLFTETNIKYLDTYPRLLSFFEHIERWFKIAGEA